MITCNSNYLTNNIVHLNLILNNENEFLTINDSEKSSNDTNSDIDVDKDELNNMLEGEEQDNIGINLN